MPVPTVQHVLPGAAVHIVLKADQRTGRTVSGTVADVLTRGNHPRGIKVRLADGRVGRVQSMAAPGSSPSPSSGLGLGRGPGQSASGPPSSALPSQHIGLDAYISHGKPRQHTRGGRGRRRNGNGPSNHAGREAEAEEEKEVPGAAPAVVCPVCAAFHGDEAAVAHHVAGHFND